MKLLSPPLFPVITSLRGGIFYDFIDLVRVVGFPTILCFEQGLCMTRTPGDVMGRATRNVASV